MFSSKVKKFIATILIFAMTMCSAGFTTLASTMNSAYKIAETNIDGRREEFSLRYYSLYSSRIQLLQNTDNENNSLNEGDTSKSDSGEVQNKNDSSGDAGVGAGNSSTDEDNKTTSDDSSSLNENKDDNKDSDVSPSVKEGSNTSSPSDAEDEDTKNKTDEEPEEGEGNKNTSSPSDAEETKGEESDTDTKEATPSDANDTEGATPSDANDIEGATPSDVKDIEGATTSDAFNLANLNEIPIADASTKSNLLGSSYATHDLALVYFDDYGSWIDTKITSVGFDDEYYWNITAIDLRQKVFDNMPKGYTLVTSGTQMYYALAYANGAKPTNGTKGPWTSHMCNDRSWRVIPAGYEYKYKDYSIGGRFGAMEKFKNYSSKYINAGDYGTSRLETFPVFDEHSYKPESKNFPPKYNDSNFYCIATIKVKRDYKVPVRFHVLDNDGNERTGNIVICEGDDNRHYVAHYGSSAWVEFVSRYDKISNPGISPSFNGRKNVKIADSDCAVISYNKMHYHKGFPEKKYNNANNPIGAWITGGDQDSFTTYTQVTKGNFDTSTLSKKVDIDKRDYDWDKVWRDIYKYGKADRAWSKTPGGAPYDFNTELTYDDVTNGVDLYLKVDWKRYKIKYDLSGGDWDGYTPTGAAKERAYNQTLKNSDLPKKDKLYKKGWTFSHWTYKGNTFTELSGNNDTEYELKAVWTKNPVKMNTNWYGSTHAKSNITKIEFKAGAVPANYDEEFAVQAKANGNSSAYRKGNVITIVPGTNGKFTADASLANLFKDFTNLEEIDFGNLFDTSNVTNISSMFENDAKLKSVNFTNINLANVTNADGLFKNSEELTGVTFGDNAFTNKLTSAKEMFNGAKAITTIDLSKSKLTNVTNAESMFDGCTALTSVTFGTGMTQVTNAKSMFKNSKIATIDLSTFDLSKLTTVDSMFEGCSELTTINSTTDVKNTTTGTDVFKDCTKLVGGSTYKFNTNHTDAEFARIDLGGILPGYFTVPDSLYSSKNIKISDINIDDAKKLGVDTIEINNEATMPDYDEEIVINTTRGLYAYKKNNKIFIHFTSKINKLSGTGSLQGAFSHFSDATSISGLDKIDTKDVTNMSYMFQGNRSLTSLDVSSFDTSKVTNMSAMFAGLNAATSIDVTGFNTKNVLTMDSLFASCSNITSIDLDVFNFNKVTDASSMFEDCSNLTTINVKNNVRAFGQGDNTVKNVGGGLFGAAPSGVNTDNMFAGCTSLVGGSGSTYFATKIDGEFARVDYGSIMPGYFTIDDYTKVPKLKLKNDFANGLTNKTSITQIEFIRGPIGTQGIDYDSEVVLYNDADHGGDIIGYMYYDILKIAYGKADGSTIPTLYAVEDFSGAFSGFTSLTAIQGLDNLDTSETKNMSSLFRGDTSLVTLNLEGLRFNIAEDLSSMFENCRSLTTINYHATDATRLPGLTVQNMSNMFNHCEAMVTVDVSRYRTSNATNLSSMFANMTSATNFNLAPGLTAKAEDLSRLFYGCTSLVNLDLDAVSVTRATDLSEMFADCGNLQQLSLLGFITTNVQSMRNMFHNCRSLRTIYSDDFDTTSLTDNGANMFENCDVLDSNAGTTYAAAGVTDATYAIVDDLANGRPGYFAAPNIYKLAPDWDNNATSLDRTTIKKVKIVQAPEPEPTSFVERYDIDRSYGLVGYTTQNGSDIEVVIYAASESSAKQIYMSTYATKLFGEDTDTTRMFSNLEEIENLNIVNTNRTVNMEQMFMNTKLTSIDLSNFNTSNVMSMKSMFENIDGLTTLDISTFDTGIVSDMSYMFAGDKDLTTIIMPSISFGDGATNMSYMFANCESLANTGGTSFDISNFNLGNSSNLSYMFYNAKEITDIMLPSRNIGANATDMSHMFDGASKIPTINASNFSVANAVDMSYMFASMSELTGLNLSTWMTGNVTDMSYMMANCKKITSLTLPEEAELAHVTNISYMFNNIEDITTLTVPAFAAVTNMEGAFKGMNDLTNLTLPDNFIGNVTSIKSLFEGCANIKELNLTTWNTQYVIDMSYLFKDCTNLDTIKASDKFRVSQVTSDIDMFLNATSIVGHEGTVYDSAHIDKTYAIIDNVSAGNPGYFTGKEYTFGPGWNYSGDKNTITKIKFEKLSGALPTGTYPVEGGLRAFNNGTELTLYIVKPTVDVQLVENSSRLFDGCENVTTIENLNYLKSDNVTNMSYMFASMSELAGTINISSLNTDRVSDTHAMFMGDKKITAITFPSNFGMSSKDMGSMFKDCTALNLTYTETSKIRTYSAEDMSHMFEGVEGTTALALTNFVTATVSNMKAMFKGAKNLTSINVSSFDTKNVTDMSYMFDGLERINALSVANFRTEKVTDMTYMFRNVKNISNLITNFNTANVVSMKGMFSGVQKVSSLDLQQFDTSLVTDMSEMFKDTSSLMTIRVDATRFVTNEVTDMSHMFDGAKKYGDINSLISSFNTEKVTDMSYMFATNSTVASLDLSNFDMSNVKNISYMFGNDTVLSSVLFPNDFVTETENLSGLFYNCKSIQVLDLTNWNTASASDMSYMFAGASALVTIDVSEDFVTTAVTNSENMFRGCINILGFAGTRYDNNHVDKEYAIIDGTALKKGYLSAGVYEIGANWEFSGDKTAITKISFVSYPNATPSNVTEDWIVTGGLHAYKNGTELTLYASNAKPVHVKKNASGLFAGFTNLATIENLEILDTVNTKNMSHMFENAYKLTSFDISFFNTRNVTDMSYMFANTRAIESLDVHQFVTSSVSDMSYMFSGMESLSNLQLGSFDTREVTNMSSMFSGDKKLLETPTNGFDTSKVTNMSHMFEGMESLIELSFSSFNTKNVTDMSYMFNNVASVSTIDVSTFDTRNALDVSYMFSNNTDLKTIYATSKFQLVDGTIDTNMFANSRNIVGGAGTTWVSSKINGEYARIDKGALRPGYFQGQVYFAHLMADGGVFIGGSDEKTVSIVADESTNKFEKPTRDGYEFENYYVNDVVIDSTWTYITSKTTDVVAKWKPKEYKVYYYANGGVGNMAYHTITYGSDILSQIKANEFTRTGYDFSEWSFNGVLSSTINTMAAAASTPVNDFIWAHIVNSGITDIKLTANWKGKPYKVVYHGNNGKLDDGATEYEENDITFGKDYRLQNNRFKYDGYLFNGWGENSDSSRKYAALATVSFTTYKATVDLYADWVDENEAYGKLILKGNGGSVNGAKEDTILLTHYNPVPAATTYRKGYRFTHWASGSDIVPYPTTCDFKEMTLTANWEPIDYTVRYYSNDGTTDFVDKPQKYDRPFAIASYSGAARFGYTTSGWTDDVNNNNVKYIADAVVNNLTDNDNSRVELYAVWQGNNYNITLHNFDLDTDADLVQAYTYGANAKLPVLASDSKISDDGTYLTFSGWATDSSADRVVYYGAHFADSIYEDMQISNIDLYPVWIDAATSVNLTFDANEGTINGDKTLTVSIPYGKAIPYPNTNTIKRMGHTFLGWKDAKVGGNTFNEPAVNFVLDKTIYADWSEGTYTIRYVGVEHTSGDMTGDDTVLNYSATTSILDSKFKRTGYKFLGWDTDPSAKTVKYTTGQEVSKLGEVNSVVNLYTVWEAKIYTIIHYDVHNNFLGRVFLKYDEYVDLLSNANFDTGMIDDGFEYIGTSGTKIFVSGQRVTKDDFDITDTTSPESGITLRGRQKAVIYEVKFYSGKDGLFPDDTDTKIATINYADAIVWPANPRNVVDPTLGFMGWGIRDSATGRLRIYSSATYDLDHNVTFEAIYLMDTYKAKLDPNGGTFKDGTTEKVESIKYGEITSKLSIPSRPHYKFDYYSIGDEVLEATWSYIEIETENLVANWTPTNYRVVYSPGVDGQGSMGGFDIATYGEAYKIRANQFERDGYEFIYWYDAANMTFYDAEDEILDPANLSDGVLYLTATWTNKDIRIIYDGNGANRLSSQYNPSTGLFGKIVDTKMKDSEFRYGALGTKIQKNAYIREGYTFLGWGLSPNSTVAYSDEALLNFKDTYEEEIKLYAIWQKDTESYGSLTLKGNGGTVNGSEELTLGLEIEEPIPKPTLERVGYRFTYWSTDEAGQDRVEYPERCNFEEGVLYANWAPVNYIIRLYDNNNASNAYTDVIATYDSPTRLINLTGKFGEHERFLGYAYNNSKLVPDINTLTVTNLANEHGKIVNLFGVWEGKQYIVWMKDFDILKHTNNALPVTYGAGTRIPGVPYTVATINNVRKVFVGWRATDSDLYDAEFLDGQLADKAFDKSGFTQVVSGVINRRINLYPVWVDDTGATIVFDGNEGLISEDKRTSARYSYGDKVIFPARNTLYRKGWKFRNWVDDDGNIYDENNTYVNFVKDKVIKVAWDVGTYDIHYHTSGEETIVKSDNTETMYDSNKYFKKTYYGNVDTVISDNLSFERPGYEFVGWDDNEVADTVVYKVGQAVEPMVDADETINLYAVWKSRTYTIEYYDSDGNPIGTNTMLYGKNARVLGNDGISESEKDAGFAYTVNGRTYHFSSGQSISGKELEIDITTSGGVITPHTSGLFGAPSSDPFTGTIKLYGEKTPAIYKITFDANGGEFVDGDLVKIATASTGDLMATKYPTVALRNGRKAFLGWEVEQVEFTSPTYPYSSSVTIKAIWEKEYKARLHANGGYFADGTATQLVDMRAYEKTHKLEIPVYPGYTFENYYVGDELLRASWSYIINAVTDVNARWTPNDYRVVYAPGGAVGNMEPTIATYGTTFALRNNEFKKDGYEFAGWKFNDTTTYANGANVSNLTTEKNGVAVLTATWKAKKYKITYIGNGGVNGAGANTYSESGLTYGEDHELLPNTFTQAGYTFRGWALDSKSAVTYYNKGVVSKDASYVEELKLYAIWLLDTEKYGKLILHGGGGLINGVTDVTIDLRREEAINKPTLERLGFTFDTWVNTNTGVATIFPTVWKNEWTAPIELTARWNQNRYTVRYYNDTNNFVDDTPVYYGSPSTVRATNIFTKTNYNNTKWIRYVDGIETEMVAGSSFSKLSSIDGDIVKIYANWVGTNYTVNLHDVDRLNPGVNKTKTYEYGKGTNIDSVVNRYVIVNDVSYEFAGWATVSGATKAAYYDSINSDILFDSEGNTTIDLWPVWLDVNDIVHLTFNGNGGYVNGREQWTIAIASNSEFAMPLASQVKRDGYNFVEWQDKPSGGTLWNLTTIDKDTMIYATWTPSGTYTLNYVAVGMGVSGSMPSQNKGTNVDVTLALNTYTRPGYKFIGWDINPEANKVVYKDNATTKPLGKVGDNVNLYTVWKANEYTITYYDNDGAFLATNSIVYGKTTRLLANTKVPRGSTDAGWANAPSGTSLYSSGQIVGTVDLGITATTDEKTGIKLYGLTDRITYVIIFDANGGTYFEGTVNATTSITTTVRYGDLIPWPATPSYIDITTGDPHKFNGYTVEGSYYPDYNKTRTYDLTKGVTFKGLWDQVGFAIFFHKNEPMSPDITKSNVATGTMEPQPAFSDVPFILRHNTFAISGYEFIGWATASYTQYEAEAMRDANSPLIIKDGPEDTLDPRAIPLRYTRNLGEDMDFYALWGRTKTKVRIYRNELDGQFTEPDPFVHETEFDIYYDSEFYNYPQFDSTGKVRPSYMWSGYFTKVRIDQAYDRVNYIYSENTAYHDYDVNRTTGTLILYPLWYNIAVFVNMTYDTAIAELPDGHTLAQFTGFMDAPYYTKGNLTEGRQQEADGSYKLMDLIATPHDVYIYDGWFENYDPATNTYSDKIDKNTIYTGKTEIFGNVRVRDNYVLSYKGNGGQGYMPDEVLTEGLDHPISANQFTNNNADFVNWRGSDGKLYGSTDKIVNPKRPLTLNAQWQYHNSDQQFTGRGGRGGGGGGGRGASLSINSVDFVSHYAINEADLAWIKDKDGNRTGLKVKTTSPLAIALMSDSKFNSHYLVLADDSEYIRLKGGFFKTWYHGGGYYFGFDEFGNLMTGFVVTTIDTEHYELDPNTNTMIMLGIKSSGKYLLYMDEGEYKGIIWNIPITISNILYTFDEGGRVISEVEVKSVDENNKEDASWQYSPKTDSWKYYIKEPDGKVTYYMDGIYPIEYLGQKYYYAFDKQGNMITGLFEYNGNTYYLTENGKLKGTVYVGFITLEGTNYLFGEDGRRVKTDETSVTALTHTEEVNTEENKFIP